MAFVRQVFEGGDQLIAMISMNALGARFPWLSTTLPLLRTYRRWPASVLQFLCQAPELNDLEVEAALTTEDQRWPRGIPIAGRKN
ncbi:MAG: hypothetical protein JO249_21885 [Acidobacteria bacterium]|nr:hypothetical protein [Acidobacteriota bacterium]